MTSARTFGVRGGEILIALEPARRSPGSSLADLRQKFWGVKVADFATRSLLVQSKNPDGRPTGEIKVNLDENIWNGIVFQATLSETLLRSSHPTYEEYLAQLNAQIDKEKFLTS